MGSPSANLSQPRQHSKRCCPVPTQGSNPSPLQHSALPTPTHLLAQLIPSQDLEVYLKAHTQLCLGLQGVGTHVAQTCVQQAEQLPGVLPAVRLSAMQLDKQMWSPNQGARPMMVVQRGCASCSAQAQVHMHPQHRCVPHPALHAQTHTSLDAWSKARTVEQPKQHPEQPKQHPEQLTSHRSHRMASWETSCWLLPSHLCA